MRSAVHIIRETFSYFMVNIFLVDGEELVLTDLLLPGGVSGLDLARRVLAFDRGPRLLCVSGFSEQLSPKAFSALPAGSFLQKSFSPTELLRRMREILDGR
jgi:DNA-binding response OmpR family regulator